MAIPPESSECEETIIRTASGEVRGLRVEGLHVFLGVPYAAPPVGPLRFAPPAPPAAWDGVRDATRFGATAPQPSSAFAFFPQELREGDDYLHLNIYTPSPGATGLPVLVNIHGGGFVEGSNIDRAHGSVQLARRGMVVVSINYRLGFEGFLPLPGAPANRGVLDWLAALEWVRDNIGSFGGDADKVTVSGYSAGSAAGVTLLAGPRAAGLLSRVIAMSGTPWNLVTLAEAERRADEVAERLGVEATPEAIASVTKAELFRLQSEMAPVGGIGPMSDPVADFRRLTCDRAWLGPVIDGDIVPEDPMAAIASGAGSTIDLLLGCTIEEADALMVVFGSTIAAHEANDALTAIGLDERAVRTWVDNHAGHAPSKVLGAAQTALTFRLPAIRLAESRVRAPAGTYLYEFSWRPSTVVGAVHGIDVAFAFDSLHREPTAESVRMLCGGEPPQSLADDVSGAISRFVLHGDPGWPRYDDRSRQVMAFDVPSEVRRDPARDRVIRDVFGGLR